MKAGTLRYHPQRGFAILRDYGEVHHSGKMKGQPRLVWESCGPVGETYLRVALAEPIADGGNRMTYWSPKTPARRG